MQKIVIEISFISLFLLVSPIFTWAAPSISNTNGTISHGQSVTVYGSGFGVKNQTAPFLWDNSENNYSSTIDNEIVPVDTDIFSGYSFRVNNAGSMKFATSQTKNQRGKSMVHYFGNSAYSYFRGYNYNQAGLGGGYPEMYLTWYVKTDLPSTSASTKLIRLWATEQNGRTYRLSWTTSHLTYVYTNDVGTVSYPWALTNQNLVPEQWNTWDGESAFNQWHRVELYYKASSNHDVADGKILLKTDGKIEHDLNLATWIEETPALPEYINQYPRGGNDPLNNVYLIGFDPSVDIGSYTIEMDDFYIDNSTQRIEICDSATFLFNGRMHCEIQIPQNIWTDNGQLDGAQLEMKINQGSFTDNEDAYLYVLDENGIVSDQDANMAGNQGYLVNFSSGVLDTSAPSAPSGLSVQ